jgi:hypothetical protein
MTENDATVRELADPSAVPAAEMLDLLESAWGVIANAGWDGLARPDSWQQAAERWRDKYHDILHRALHPEPPADAAVAR